MGNTVSNPSSRPQPLRIHPIHGKSIRISKNRLEATRFEGYTDSIIFGSRPVEINEEVEIIIKDTVANWNGSIRFGFIYDSPERVAAHKDGLPHYVCPDLTKRGGCFIDTQTNYVQFKKNDKIVLWVNDNGEIKLKINGFPSRIAHMKVEKNVYPLVDVYGNCTQVSMRSLKDDYSMPNGSNGPRCYNDLYMRDFQLFSNSSSVVFNDKSTEVTRTSTQMAFVWNKDPLLVNYIWFFYIKEIESVGGSLSIAITSDNPSTIENEINTLKDYKTCDNILFRQIDNAYVRMMEGDEIAICIGDTGMMTASINGGPYQKFANISKAEEYYIVADLTKGGVKSIQSVGIHRISRHPLPCLPDLDAALNYDMSDAAGASSFRSIQPSSSAGEMSCEHAQSGDINSNVKIDFICLKCKKNLPNVINIPCGHLVLCDCCCRTPSDILKPPTSYCQRPKCNKKIDMITRVYY